MALIVNSTRHDDHILLSVKLALDEAKELKCLVGHVSIIPHDSIDMKSALYERGKKGATKYLLIPKDLRKKTKIGTDVTCTTIPLQDKSLWVFLINK